MNSIKELSNKLKDCLYYNKIESTNIDKGAIQKYLFKLLRECITNKIYEIEIGSYYLNITPENLLVKYETENTFIEVSNKDIHLENTQERKIEYFVITPEEHEEYNITIPAIMVDGVINTYDDTYEEIYEITLSDDIEDDIKNYLNLNNNFTYTDNEFNTNDSIIIRRNITRETPYNDIYEQFNKRIVKPVTYNPQKDNYVKRELKDLPLNYDNVIPKLTDKKMITSYIYGLIVEFYTEYINNN